MYFGNKRHEKRILNIMNTPPQYIKIYTKSLPLPCAVQTWCNLIVNCALILYNFTVILIPAISILNVLPFICEETHPMSVENDRANCGWWMVMGKDLPAEHPLLRLQVVFTRDSAQLWVVTLCPGAGGVCCVLSIWVVNHWAVRCPTSGQCPSAHISTELGLHICTVLSSSP